MKKYHKLGAAATIFWDPTQSDPDSQKLLKDDIKLLDENPKVVQWRAQGGLVQLSEGEAQEELKKRPKQAKVDKSNELANQAMNKAAAIEQDAKNTLAEAQTIKEEAEKVLDENKLLADKNAEQSKELEELRKQLAASNKKGEEPKK